MVGLGHRGTPRKHREAQSSADFYFDLTPNLFRQTTLARPSLSKLERGPGGEVKNALLLLCFLLGISTFAQTNLIPKVEEVHVLGDTILVSNDFSIVAPFEFQDAKANLKEVLVSDFNSTVSVDKVKTGSFAIVVTKVENRWQNDEGYAITIMPGGIWVEAASQQGAFRAVQTIRQMLLFSPKMDGNSVLLAMSIEDAPAFPHRGLLLDVCRHFFSVTTVKKYIDLLAFYKMNTLHWHLTEDQGWRIQIDKYPKLTEVGAWRAEKDSSVYGGFYTKDQIREVVAYAASRGITVIPEIEMPGHSQAALAAYPHLSCAGDTGIKVANDWGVFKEIYCAGNDSVFAFLEDVLTEVTELFPSKYIHIGGDEAPKYRWEHCPKCQKRMADKGLKDEHELQSYFITRIEKFLNAHGRELIGWDEILEGGLSPNATVQSWRGMEHGKTAAQQKHNVVMSPTSHCYLDYNLRSINLEKVYRFNPIPEGLDSAFEKYILGGEVNMWTEHVPNDSALDSKVFPRLIALAEVLWNGPGGNYDDFYNRLQNHYPILEKWGVNYGLEAEPVSVKSIRKNDSTFIVLTPGSSHLKLEFSYCRSVNQLFQQPIYLNCTGNLWVQALKDGSYYGDSVSVPIINHLALGSEPKYSTGYSMYYPAGGAMGLVDGLTGSIDFRDGRWQGFAGTDAAVEIDLGAAKTVSTLSMNFYEYPNAWIMLPQVVSVHVSADGQTWQTLPDEMIESNPQAHTGEKQIVGTEISVANEQPVRYLKIRAKNYGTLPHWHEAAGSDAWLFVDEIVVR